MYRDDFKQNFWVLVVFMQDSSQTFTTFTCVEITFQERTKRRDTVNQLSVRGISKYLVKENTENTPSD